MTRGPGSTRFSFFGHPLPDEKVATWPDNLVCKDNADGALIVRRRTERHVPIQPAPVADKPMLHRKEVP